MGKAQVILHMNSHFKRELSNLHMVRENQMGQNRNKICFPSLTVFISLLSSKGWGSSPHSKVGGGGGDDDGLDGELLHK